MQDDDVPPAADADAEHEGVEATTCRSDRRRRTDRVVSWPLHGAVIAGAAGAVAIDRRVQRALGRDLDVAAPMVSVAFYGLLWAIETRRPHREDWRPSRDEVATDGSFLLSVFAAQGAGMALAAPVQRRMTQTLGVDLLPQFLEMLVDMLMETVSVGALGLSRVQCVAYPAVQGMHGQVQHSNIERRSGALDHVFSTPDLHRWHHSTVYEKGDTNDGAVTSLWDKVFGTFFRPEDRDGPDALRVGRMPDLPRRFGELERVPVDWSVMRERNAETRLDGQRRHPTSAAAGTPVRP